VRDLLIQIYVMFSINQLVVVGAEKTMHFVCLATGATVRSI